ncbi:RHS repeat-associated core domain-containing protein, partial [Frateuria sp. Soil773]|uniref:RHS repeat-associated core domain-containing protein n=1 Tax=Frateuria sp. Soil773 TaxID=1736407 RepID=UPI002E0FDAD0
LGRPTSVGNGQETRIYSYDTCTNGKGRLCRMAGSDSVTTHSWSTFAYTPEGWLATRQDAMQNTVNITGYTYDGLGRSTGISYPSGVAVGYAYDHGKLIAVTSTRGGTTTTIASGFRYQPFGAATEWVYGNGLKHSASFDLDGRLTHLGASNGVTVRQNLSYGYNQGDEITAITNGTDATQNRAYAYDTAGRLSQDTLSNLAWSFDANGNHNRFTSPGGQTDYVIEPTSNRVSSYATLAGVHTNYQYDARGNRSVAQEQPGITQSYAYDVFNRLSTVTTGTQVTKLLYNAQDQRVGKTADGSQTRYIYVGNQLATEYGSAGWKSYIWAGPELLGVVRDNGATYFVHNDHLGRPEVVTGASLEVVWRAANSPYGRTIVQDNIEGLNLGFPGQYQDVETGLWINGYRTYDESIGRYLESDPIGLGGGANTYTYVSANPLGYVDPYGLEQGKAFNAIFKADGGVLQRSNDGYHYYSVWVPLCAGGCTLNEAFDAMRNFSAPGAPAAQDGSRNLVLLGITSGNPINQTVDPCKRTIANVTLPGHLFGGSVTISIIQQNGVIGAQIIGTGIGPNPILNQLTGPLIFRALGFGARESMRESAQ